MRNFLRSFCSRPLCPRRFSEQTFWPSRATKHGENIGLGAASRHYLSLNCLLLHLSKSRKWLQSIAERHWTVDFRRPLYSSAFLILRWIIYTMLRLWSHFSRQFVGSVGCWQLQSPLSHQGTGRKGAWKIYGQAINGISEFSVKFSRNGEKMLCFHFLVGRLAVVIPCRLMTISFPRSLALSDSISMFIKTC